MGWGRVDLEQIKQFRPSSERLSESLASIVSFYYEPMLNRLELGKEQISKQPLDQLRESLDRVNE